MRIDSLQPGAHGVDRNVAGPGLAPALGVLRHAVGIAGGCSPPAPRRRWWRGRARPRGRPRPRSRAPRRGPAPGRAMGNQPSAMRPTRRSAAGANAPIQIGMGRWTGSGASPAAVMWWKRPSTVTLSCVQSWRSTPICSSKKAPRSAKDWPSASYSTRFHPMPSPSRNVPPDSDVELGRLLGQQGGLALGPDEDRGGEAQLGEPGQVREEHQRLMEGVVDVVGAADVAVHRRVGAQHVVVGRQVGVAQVGGGLPVGAHRAAVAARARSAGTPLRFPCRQCARVHALAW